MTAYLLLLMKLGVSDVVVVPDTYPICGRMTLQTAITGYMSLDQTIDGKMTTDATIHGYMETNSCQ